MRTVKYKVSCVNGAFKVETATFDEVTCRMVPWTQHCRRRLYSRAGTVSLAHPAGTICPILLLFPSLSATGVSSTPTTGHQPSVHQGTAPCHHLLFHHGEALSRVRGTDALWSYMTLSSYVVPLVLLEDFHLRPAPAAHGVAAPGASERGGVPEGEGQDPRGGAKVCVALHACVQCQGVQGKK